MAAAFFAGPARAAVDLRVEARPVSSPIEAYVTVTDAGGQPVGGLSAGNFTVTLDGKPITIAAPNLTLPPAQNPAQRVSVVFVMDYSPSTEGAPRIAMQDAVVSFVNAMTDGDWAAIVKFNGSSKATVVQPFTEISAAARTQLNAVAMTDYPGTKTNLYDAVELAVGQFGAASATLPTGPKAVIVLSDGLDNDSVATLNSVLDKASIEGLSLFAISLAAAGTSGEQVLQALSARTGGVYIPAPSDAAIGSAYATISALLSNGYLLRFQPSPNITDCSVHELVVQVTGQASSSVKFTRCDAAKPTPAKKSGGGGGAMGVPELLFGLAALFAVRRRRAA